MSETFWLAIAQIAFALCLVLAWVILTAIEMGPKR